MLLFQAGVLFVCLLVAGCGGQPFHYQPDHELKPGPGLFSGKDGEFTLLGSPKSKATKPEPKQQEQQQE